MGLVYRGPAAGNDRGRVVSAPGTGARNFAGTTPRPPWGLMVGIVLAVGGLLGLATAPAAHADTACEERQTRALEVLAEQSRRQAAALERIAERLR